jgi:hypothetical protein
MTKQIEVTGALNITGDCCGGSGGGQTTKQLGLGAPGCASSQTYQASVAECIELNTGVPGTTFVDVHSLDALTAIYLLYLRTNQHVILRLYAVAASAVGNGGTYPTGFAGGETLITTIDGVVVTTTFTAAAQLLADVVNEVNASMALAGIATPRASAENGQLRIDGVATRVDGASGTLTFGGTGAATLGMDPGSNPTIVDAQGQDIDVQGLYMNEFPRTGDDAPTAAQISGTATVEVVAAGDSQ